jgi:hypothetical protein
MKKEALVMDEIAESYMSALLAINPRLARAGHNAYYHPRSKQQEQQEQERHSDRDPRDQTSPSSPEFVADAWKNNEQLRSTRKKCDGLPLLRQSSLSRHKDKAGGGDGGDREERRHVPNRKHAPRPVKASSWRDLPVSDDEQSSEEEYDHRGQPVRASPKAEPASAAITSTRTRPHDKHSHDHHRSREAEESSIFPPPASASVAVNRMERDELAAFVAKPVIRSSAVKTVVVGVQSKAVLPVDDDGGDYLPRNMTKEAKAKTTGSSSLHKTVQSSMQSSLAPSSAVMSLDSLGVGDNLGKTYPIDRKAVGARSSPKLLQAAASVDDDDSTLVGMRSQPPGEGLSIRKASDEVFDSSLIAEELGESFRFPVKAEDSDAHVLLETKKIAPKDDWRSPARPTRGEAVGKMARDMRSISTDMADEDDPFAPSFSSPVARVMNDDVDVSCSVIVDFDRPIQAPGGSAKKGMTIRFDDTVRTESEPSGRATNRSDTSSPALVNFGSMNSMKRRSGGYDDMVLMSTSPFTMTRTSDSTNTNTNSNRATPLLSDTALSNTNQFEKDSLGNTAMSGAPSVSELGDQIYPLNEEDDAEDGSADLYANATFEDTSSSAANSPVKAVTMGDNDTREVRTQEEADQLVLQGTRRTDESFDQVLENLTWSDGKAPIELLELAYALEVNIGAIGLNKTKIPSSVHEVIIPSPFQPLARSEPTACGGCDQVYVTLEFLDAKSATSRSVHLELQDSIYPLSFTSREHFSHCAWLMTNA